MNPIVFLLNSSIKAGTPLVMAAVGELIAEKSGIVNLGLEGMMLVGALAAFAGVWFSGIPWIGLLLGMIAGTLLSLIHGFVCISRQAGGYKGGQYISGITLNFLALGLTTALGRGLAGYSIKGLKVLAFPVLAKIPLIGPLVFQLFQFDITVYGAFLITLGIWLFLKTPWGLKLTACGERPALADSLGINVAKYQYLAVMVGGALSGLGGACLVLSLTHFWQSNLTAFRGWIAVALVIVGGWKPWLIFLMGYLFGAAETASYWFQVMGVHIRSQILQMFPFALTFLLLSLHYLGRGITRKWMPSALGKSYDREKAVR